MSIERQFAEKLDGREDIKLFMKLPAKFKVPTPQGLGKVGIEGR